LPATDSVELVPVVAAETVVSDAEVQRHCQGIEEQVGNAVHLLVKQQVPDETAVEGEDGHVSPEDDRRRLDVLSEPTANDRLDAVERHESRQRAIT